MNNRLKIISLLIMAAIASYYLMSRPGSSVICFKDSCVNVELAENQLSRAKGLMFRESLSPDAGMLFIFEGDGEHSFWMKNTLIPLDMIWLDSGLQVVHIEHANPCRADPCESYEPHRLARYVLEVNGGYTVEHDIRVGDGADMRLK